jgi:hypothetical protein
VQKAQRDTEKYHGALLGAGGTAAGLSVSGEKILGHQGRKWANRAGQSIDESAKIVPNMGGRRGPIARVSDNEVVRSHKKVLAGKSKKQAEAAGRFRGDATQAKYFAGVYHKTAGYARKIRNPALATAAVGGGGLLLARKKDSVKKNLSAFGVEH